MQKQQLTEVLTSIHHRIPWEEWDMSVDDYGMVNAASGSSIVDCAYQSGFRYGTLMENADEMIDKNNFNAKRDVAKTLKTLKLDLMTELPRNKKTREPLIDSGQVERRLLQEVIDEIAGLDSLPVVVQTEAMNVDDGVALLPPAAPSFAARLTGERFAASISLNRDNITINEPPPPGIDLGVDEMPEATLDVLAGMGLFTGSLARPLYTKMIQQQLPSPLPEVLIGGPVEPHAIPTDVAPNLNAVVPNVPVANTPQLPDAEFIELETPLDPRPSRRKLFESLSVEPPVASQQKRKPRHKPRRALHAQDEDAEKSKKNRPLIWHPAKPTCQIHQQLSLHLIVAVFDGLEHYGEDDVEEPPREEERINEPPELPLIPPIDEGNRNRIPLSEMFQHEPVLPFPESSQHLPVPSLPETSQHQLVPPVPEIPQHQPVPSLPDLSQHQPVPPMPRDFEHYQTPKRRKVSLAENIRGESGEPRVSMPDPSTPLEKALVTSTPLLNPLTQLTDIDIDFGNYQLKSLQNLRQCAAPADPEVSSAMPKAAKHLQRFIQDGEQFLICGGEDFSEYCLETFGLYVSMRFIMEQSGTWTMKFNELLPQVSITKPIDRRIFGMRLRLLESEGFVNLSTTVGGDIDDVEIPTDMPDII